MEWEFTSCISGRYKYFKKEVDLVRDEFITHRVNVLQPSPGSIELIRSDGFTPLKPEIYLPTKVIEDSFFRAIDLSDFLYIVNPDGEIGTMVQVEIGYAIARDLPIFSSNQIKFKNADNHEVRRYSVIRVATVQEVIKIMGEYRDKLNANRGELTPKFYYPIH